MDRLFVHIVMAIQTSFVAQNNASLVSTLEESTVVLLLKLYRLHRLHANSWIGRFRLPDSCAKFEILPFCARLKFTANQSTLLLMRQDNGQHKSSRKLRDYFALVLE